MSEPQLTGRRVVLTRPAGRPDGAEALLAAEGARTSRVPLLEISPPPDGGAGLRSALRLLTPDGWIALTSISAIPVLVAVAGGASGLAHHRLAVVGAATAVALREAGLEPAIVGDGTGGAALGRLLGDPSRPGEPIVLALAAEPRPELAEVLGAAGWEVHQEIAYQTGPVALDEPSRVALAAADVVVLTSPKAAAALAAQLGDRAVATSVVAIGPTTAAGAAAVGFGSIIVAEEPSPAAVLEAVVASCRSMPADA